MIMCGNYGMHKKLRNPIIIFLSKVKKNLLLHPTLLLLIAKPRIDGEAAMVVSAKVGEH